MVLREQDKHFLASLYAAVAVIFAWKGLWDGVYVLPYVSEMISESALPFVFLSLGLAMLTFSGLIFKEFDPLGSIQKATSRMLHSIQISSKKHKFSIKYYDKSRKKQVTIKANQIKKIEKGTIIIKHPDRREEVFIPTHRVTEVLYEGKRYWRL